MESSKHPAEDLLGFPPSHLTITPAIEAYPHLRGVCTSLSLSLCALIRLVFAFVQMYMWDLLMWSSAHEAGSADAHGSPAVDQRHARAPRVL
jgi:hypothetical protein